MMDFIVSNAGVIGLLFFMTLFTLVLISVFRPSKTEDYKDHAAIPLKEIGNE
ncbi:MAG: cbb3-type cytochrome c oxidase subunit 3 [Pseudobdellovibrionaceae bacterium]